MNDERNRRPVVCYRGQKSRLLRWLFFALLNSSFILHPSSFSYAATVADSLNSPPTRTRRPTKPTSTTLFDLHPEVRYTAAQVDTILDRADKAWRGYFRLRPLLRAGDAREQAFAHRAVVLRARAGAMERLLADEKRNPTREGPQTITDGLTSLDRSTAAVEYDLDRISLRIKQEAVLPPGLPFCVCIAPAFVRISPTGPTNCPPATKPTLTLAAGEAESFQLIVVPYWDRLERVRVRVSDLFRRNSIDRFGPDQVKLWLVESVATTSTVGRGQFWPDPLAPPRPFDLPATASQAILVDIRARRDQPAGAYTGTLTVRTDNFGTFTLPLEVDVHAFALPEGPLPDVENQTLRPAVAFRARNDFLQARLAVPGPSIFVRLWQEFLGAYGLALYRQAGPGDSAAGWLPWLGEGTFPPGAARLQDPYSPTAPTAFAFRQAAWAAWKQQSGNPAAEHRWLVNGWVSLDPSTSQPAGTGAPPLVRNRWLPGQSLHPPGLIYLNHAGESEPTLRLITLRDGIEDYQYLDHLARQLDEVKKRKAAGWWKRRKWANLLRVDSKLCDPSRISAELASKILSRREEIAAAIEETQRLLEKSKR
jgi:hypothetical protein